MSEQQIAGAVLQLVGSVCIVVGLVRLRRARRALDEVTRRLRLLEEETRRHL